MLENFKDFIPSTRKVIESMQKPDVWALFYHLPAATYYNTNPPICLVGDAAHASTPQQGAGAGMCVEDVYVLSELLSQCHQKKRLVKAFHAYDAVRRPRSQRLVTTSKEAGKLWQFEGEGVGDDLEALRGNALSRMDWIWDCEISDDLKTARRIMEAVSPNTP
jgi:salicylate hydroxylase